MERRWNAFRRALQDDPPSKAEEPLRVVLKRDASSIKASPAHVLSREGSVVSGMRGHTDVNGVSCPANAGGGGLTGYGGSEEAWISLNQ